MARRKQACSYPPCTEEWSILRCSRCKSAHYCCREHQALHWKTGHREKCDAFCLARANSESALVRRDLLLEGGREAVATKEGAEGLAKKGHVHAKVGLRAALARQRNTVAGLNARLLEVQRALAAAKGGEAAPVLSEPYRRTSKPEGRDLSVMDPSELAAFERETLRLRDLAAQSCEEMERDLGSVRDWERFESGFETRDVLANGERRKHMELRYGREVTVDDVEKEIQLLSRDQRKLRLIEGIGKDGADGRLPGPVAVDSISTLLKIEHCDNGLI